MTVKYAVTFEFELNPPLTYRGQVTGGHPSTCMRLATKEAYQLLKPVRWSSAVCVLLERVEVAAEGSDISVDSAESIEESISG